MAQTKYLTVSALTKYIKRKFDFDPYLQDFYLKGEISNLKKHSSGHLYFTLKDDQARLLAIMFASQARSVPFTPENGMSVLVRGEISVYEANGQYQMYVKEMKPDGVGSLFLAFEQLKEKLEKEGLFSQERKKKIPLFPKTVGVVTSPTGAAVRDIITTIQRRFPIGKVILFPALVQGEQAPPSIVEAIEKAKNYKVIDVLIVGRGGGSIEELWAFNDERVARAIASSPIPIISAVGHETDFTISDFVADLRAPTPTGAAELAVPLLEDLYQRIHDKKLRLTRAIGNKLKVDRINLGKLTNSYALRSPRRLYIQKMEKMDRLHETLHREMQRLIGSNHDKREVLQNRLLRSAPLAMIKRKSIEREVLQRNLQRNMLVHLEKQKQTFSVVLHTLQALNPLSILERGYSVTYSETGQLVKSIHSVEKGDTIRVNVKDGILHCEIHEKENIGHEGRS
ncbi:exodeoxyribonuclease VII large subunit [Bacillus litorisediminis]|uniref:exodeoxyribonuclease VII large subunit n=1 Tax=Bacillus litorisediminis TaxID=2922713 RepID=UPI001FAFBF0A|nr:exodeoxyribonuclease VII large subunit [Bacillus litorisediminis]